MERSSVEVVCLVLRRILRPSLVTTMGWVVFLRFFSFLGASPLTSKEFGREKCVYLLSADERSAVLVAPVSSYPGGGDLVLRLLFLSLLPSSLLSADWTASPIS